MTALWTHLRGSHSKRLLNVSDFRAKCIRKPAIRYSTKNSFSDGVYISEFQQARLKIKLLDRLGVSRCEPIGEALIALADESITWGENVTRNLQEKAGRKQVR